MGYAIRTDRYRYIEWYAWNDNKKGDLIDVKLFDHANDPLENKNVAYEAASQTIVGQLTRQLNKGWRYAGPRADQ